MKSKIIQLDEMEILIIKDLICEGIESLKKDLKNSNDPDDKEFLSGLINHSESLINKFK